MPLASRCRAGSAPPCASASNPVTGERRDAMKTNCTTSLVPRRWGTRITSLLAALGLSGGVVGCSGLLDVNNPNSVPIKEIGNPAGAKSLTNGVQASVGRAWNDGITLMSVASDELRWVGSRDAWNTLDQGSISEPTNEFVDAAFPYLGEARWLADTAIQQLEVFRSARTLPDTNDLARVYLYGAIIYTALGNFWEDFPLASSERKAAPPVSAANMAQTFDSAIVYTTRGIAALQTVPVAGRIKDLELALTTTRAWADRKSTRLNSSHGYISYAVFCLKKKKKQKTEYSRDHSITDMIYNSSPIREMSRV